MKKFLQFIFSIKNVNQRKVLCILGLKIKFKRNKNIDEISKIIDYKYNKLLKDIIFHQRMSNQIQTVHSKVFPQFKNINTGKDVVILGTAPSLDKYVPIENAIHIGLNKASMYDKVKLDYLFMVDYMGLTYIDDALDYNCIKFFGEQCNLDVGRYNEEKQRSGHIPESELCKHNAYRFYANAHRMEIYNNLESFPLADMGSVAFSAINFALYTNPKRIYLVGIDLAQTGYSNAIVPNFNMSNSGYAWTFNLAKQGFHILKDFAKEYYPETEIISINPVGLKGLFEDVYQNEEG